MKVKTLLFPVLTLTIISVFYSCASAPAPEGQPPVTVSPAAAADSTPTPATAATSGASIDTSINPDSSRDTPAPAAEPVTEIIRHKGSEAGTDLIPSWVTAYLTGDIEAVEALDDFAGVHCFVSEGIADNLQDASTAAMESVPEAGARQVALWWMQVRRPLPDNTIEDFYTVFVLYTTPRN